MKHYAFHLPRTCPAPVAGVSTRLRGRVSTVLGMLRDRAARHARNPERNPTPARWGDILDIRVGEKPVYKEESFINGHGKWIMRIRKVGA